MKFDLRAKLLDFHILNALAARFDFYLNVDLFCKPKTS